MHANTADNVRTSSMAFDSVRRATTVALLTAVDGISFNATVLNAIDIVRMPSTTFNGVRGSSVCEHVNENATLFNLWLLTVGLLVNTVKYGEALGPYRIRIAIFRAVSYRIHCFLSRPYHAITTLNAFNTYFTNYYNSNFLHKTYSQMVTLSTLPLIQWLLSFINIP